MWCYLLLVSLCVKCIYVPQVYKPKIQKFRKIFYQAGVLQTKIISSDSLFQAYIRLFLNVLRSSFKQR
jgi:hypothetical protein